MCMLMCNFVHVLHCLCVPHVHLLLVFDRTSSQTVHTNTVSAKLQCSHCSGYCSHRGLLIEVVANRGSTVNFKIYIINCLFFNGKLREMLGCSNTS